MKYQPRVLESEILRGARNFPAVLVTGPRRSGKTTLLRHLFPKAKYVSIEDPDIVARIRSDPNSFLDDLERPAILDEIQNAPELFAYLKSRIDKEPRLFGQWLLTGSQEAPLMQGVTESLAGRVAVFHLLPFSAEESPRVSVLKGGFPEVLARPSISDLWFRSYIQTYLERDVRAVTSIRDLATFRRFLMLLATRCGQMLNKTDIAASLGVTVPTVTQWLSILEVTGQILLIAPYYENFGKRLVKTPKLYFVDPGLAASLLGIRDEAQLRESPFRGALFEGLIASEIAKHRQNRGLDRSLYYFRDRFGLEVDFVIDEGNSRLTLLETKAGKTVRPEDAAAILRLMRSIPRRLSVRAAVIYDGSEKTADTLALTPEAKAIPWKMIHEYLGRR